MQRYYLHQNNPNQREIKQIAELLNQGAIAIFPTDSVYALGCLMTNKPGIERIIKILNKKEKMAKMSIICSNISMVSEYTPQINNDVFKTMKRYTPGPYTFILNANNYVQKFFKNNKDQIGVRIIQNEILEELHKYLETPLISTSLNTWNEAEYHFTDPDDIQDKFHNLVDILIDGGIGSNEESTVLDCTGDEIEVIREGRGAII